MKLWVILWKRLDNDNFGTIAAFTDAEIAERILEMLNKQASTDMMFRVSQCDLQQWNWPV